MEITVVGIVIALLGVVVLALAPAAKRALVRNGNPQAGFLSAGNYVTGAFVLVFGILVAAHVFSR